MSLSKVSIQVPAEAFAGYYQRESVDSVRVNYVVMSNTKLFIPTEGETGEIHGYTVSASILGKTVHGLVEPVTINLPLDHVSHI